jgi:phytoene synthase
MSARRFGVTEDQIMNKIMNSNYRSLIKFEIARAREYFDKAEAGIRMLSPDARLPVRPHLSLASALPLSY